MSVAAFIAANRFGLGAAPGELDAIERDGPKERLLAQIDGPDPAVQRALAALPSSASALGEIFEMRVEEGDKSDRKAAIRDRYTAEQAVHLSAAASSERPLYERLVAFWTNHLSISLQRKEVTGLVASYEREAIRAHMGGRFVEMLGASASHPAMLAYLDNGRSIGPRSIAGMRTGKGLNENYARELLELHTLGVDGGYTQQDVTELARLLTGYSVSRGGRGEAGPIYRSSRHEPGDVVILGQRYGSAGDLLEDLSVHPSTARHIARKLVRAFVSDDPPPRAVEEIESVWRETRGDLPSVHRALVSLPEAWQSPLSKAKSPWDLVMSTARMLQSTDGILMLASLKELGQLPGDAPTPQGWPDTEVSWLGPGSLVDRIVWAQRVSLVSPAEALPLATDVLGPVLSSSTRRALARVHPRRALALLIASPEFQRR